MIYLFIIIILLIGYIVWNKINNDKQVSDLLNRLMSRNIVEYNNNKIMETNKELNPLYIRQKELDEEMKKYGKDIVEV